MGGEFGVLVGHCVIPLLEIIQFVLDFECFRNPPDVFMLLNVDFVELSFNRGNYIIFHFHGYVLGKNGQQQTFLYNNE